jgi:hypothetical protein
MLHKAKGTFSSRNQSSAGSEVKPQLKTRRCDNVLPGQGFHTPQEAVMNEYGSVWDDG